MIRTMNRWYRDQGLPLLENVTQEIQYALRGLRKSPGLTGVAILVLALAIGVSTAVFNVIDKALVRSLMIADPDRVVVLWPRDRENPTTIGEISHWTFRSWQEQVQSFETLAAMGSVNWSLLLRQGGELTTMPVAAVSASFFPLMGTRAAQGRTIAEDDDRRGAVDVVVMSHRSWVSRFGSDPTIIGRSLSLSGKPYTVVGIMPDGFEYPRGVELWIPVVPELFQASAKWRIEALESPWFGVLFVVGRLKQHVTLETARAEVSALMQRNTGDAFRPGSEAVLTPIRDHIFGKTRPALIALAVTVCLVLLIACANVATLLLIRAGGRSQETAIRMAVGGSRWHVLRQSLAEALVLSFFAGAIGLLIAHWTSNVLVTLAPGDVLRHESVRFDFSTVTFASVACMLATILTGLVPGLNAVRWNIADVLKRSDSTRTAGSRRLRRVFAVAQIAIAITLLVSAGLVGRSFVNLTRLDFGFDPTNVLTLDVTVPDAPPHRRDLFYTALLERVRHLPGVEAAGAIFLRPLEHAGIGTDASVLLEGQRVEDMKNNPGANYEAITPGYFEAMSMRVLRGRAFTNADDERAPQVVMVSDGLARRFWPGQDALGKRLIRPGAPMDQSGRPVWSTVVGVVQDARYRGITDVRFDLYVPYLQQQNDPVKHLMVKTSLDPVALGRVIRTEALRLESGALVEGATTMDDIVGRMMAPWRFSASTIGFLSVVAIIIASLGIYSIVRQSTAERTREIAVRVALGASSGDIAALVLREALTVVVAGITLGLTMAAAVSGVLTGLLFGVGRADPITFAGMAVLFGVVSLTATFFPARRAARVDPLVALRYE
jgi:putative ABC transport system permease protein